MSQFITRIHQYAVKHLKNGVSRIYIQNAKALQLAGFNAGDNILRQYSKNQIVVTKNVAGDKKIMNTGRGELLELKDKQVRRSFAGVSRVTVTLRKNKVIIQLHREDAAQNERETELIQAIENGRPLRKASFFSGLGLLALNLSEGLKSAGIETQMVFANDNCELATSCSLESNPIWQRPSEDAFVIIDDVQNLDVNKLPKVDYVEVGYPCVGQSTLCAKDKRDLEHPLAGTVFIKLLSALEQMNPAMVTFECTPAFANSKTLELIQRYMRTYNFSVKSFSGHDFGEIETRRRVCVTAVSKGLPVYDLSSLEPPKDVEHPSLCSVLEDVPKNDERWREFNHIKRKDGEKSNNFKNNVYDAGASKINGIPATYSAPKAGAPFVAHPENSTLQRHFTELEHCRLRRLPESMTQTMLKVASGEHPLVSKRGSVTALHRMLGNSVNKLLWQAIGAHQGHYLNSLINRNSVSA